MISRLASPFIFAVSAALSLAPVAAHAQVPGIANLSIGLLQNLPSLLGAAKHAIAGPDTPEVTPSVDRQAAHERLEQEIAARNLPPDQANALRAQLDRSLNAADGAVMQANALQAARANAPGPDLGGVVTNVVGGAIANHVVATQGVAIGRAMGLGSMPGSADNVASTLASAAARQLVTPGTMQAVGAAATSAAKSVFGSNGGSADNQTPTAGTNNP